LRHIVHIGLGDTVGLDVESIAVETVERIEEGER
jgi:hypothetical protein